MRNGTVAAKIDEEEQRQLKVLVGGFKGSVTRARVGPLYRLGMLLVAGAMLLLPLLYLGLVAIVAVATWHHAAIDPWLVAYAGDSTKGQFFLYVTPLVVGAILV